LQKEGDYIIHISSKCEDIETLFRENILCSPKRNWLDLQEANREMIKLQFTAIQMHDSDLGNLESLGEVPFFLVLPRLIPPALSSRRLSFLAWVPLSWTLLTFKLRGYFLQ